MNVSSASLAYKQLFPIPPVMPTTECPIHIINDLARFNISEISVRFIKCIPQIVETDNFQKLFGGVPQNVQKRWHRKKDELKQRVPRHPEFEKFRDCFSLRLGHNFRVHLRPVHGHTHWEAFEIGSHTEMGHG